MTEADLALETDDEDLDADWLLGRARHRPRRRDRGAVRSPTARTLRADGVVIATGAGRATLPGTGPSPGCTPCAPSTTPAPCAPSSRRARRLVVIGAGFIGAEVASTARALGLDVTVVEALPTPLAGPLGVEMGAVVAALHADHGVRAAVRHRRGTGSSGSDRVDAGSSSPTAGCCPPTSCSSASARARHVDWLAGLRPDRRRRRASATRAARPACPGVVAVGDCAGWYDPAVDGTTASSTGPARASARRPRSRRCSGGAAARTVAPAVLLVRPVRRPHPVRRHARPGDDGHRRGRRRDDRSFLASYRRDGGRSPCSA